MCDKKQKWMGKNGSRENFQDIFRLQFSYGLLKLQETNHQENTTC